MVIAVFVLARIERAALGRQVSAIAFTMTILCLAGGVHHECPLIAQQLCA